MLKPIALLLIYFLGWVHCQYGAPADPGTSQTPTATPTASSSSSVHTVTVGETGLAFNPNSLTAAAGSTVEFHFFPQTHSVSRSSFESPCSPLSNTSFFSGGFTTGSGSNANVFTLTINDTQPIWFYCGFPSHCQSGMGGVINPPADNSQTIAQYMAAAAKTSKTTVVAQAQGGKVGPPASQASGTGSGATPSSSTKPNNAGKNDMALLSVLAGILSLGFVILMV